MFTFWKLAEQVIVVKISRAGSSPAFVYMIEIVAETVKVVKISRAAP